IREEAHVQEAISVDSRPVEDHDHELLDDVHAASGDESEHDESEHDELQTGSYRAKLSALGFTFNGPVRSSAGERNSDQRLLEGCNSLGYTPNEIRAVASDLYEVDYTAGWTCVRSAAIASWGVEYNFTQLKVLEELDPGCQCVLYRKSRTSATPVRPD
ncbi:hypothetical protein FOZ63_023065, partial [Perkinsus olseni]